MKVLLIKTSSMGDVIHALPALTDAGQRITDIKFDWVIEPAFAEIPKWHPLVERVIPCALRRWRKNPIQAIRCGEWSEFKKQLQAQTYDYVIDAQGLIKSGFISRFAKGKLNGLDFKSARESLASLCYQTHHTVIFEQHAVKRARQLMASVLGYEEPIGVPNYGLDKTVFLNNDPEEYVVFLHGTTWASKHWPLAYWQDMAKLITQRGYKVKIPWGNETERQRAELIAAEVEQAIVLPKLNLTEIANILSQARAAVAVDTGLGHLAAALDIPTISLYGPTDPKQTGALGKNQIHLIADFPCVPCESAKCSYTGKTQIQPACFATVNPNRVWPELEKII